MPHMVISNTSDSLRDPIPLPTATRTSYFDVYSKPEDRPRITQRLGRKKALHRTNRQDDTPPSPHQPLERIKATRQASSRQSRVPSDAGSPSSYTPSSGFTTNSDLYPQLTIDTHALSVDSMDALVDTLPKSPERRSRPRLRSEATAITRRAGETDLDAQARELKARLESLSALDSSAFTLSSWQPSDSPSPISSTASPPIYPREDGQRLEELGDKPQILTIDEIIQRHSAPPKTVHSAPNLTLSRIPSIDELVHRHHSRISSRPSLSLPLPSPNNGTCSRGSAPPRVEAPMLIEEDSPRSSLDSISAEAASAAVPFRSVSSPMSQAKSRPTSISDGHSLASSIFSDSDTPRPKGRASLGVPAQNEKDRRIAEYLRSARLTKLLTVPSSHTATNKLTVSLADVGASNGHPVIVYLGLGCVRYLVALYDELAELMGLRLLCIDRWGLGRTDDIPERKRGFVEWAEVVEQVADQLGLSKFSVLAHSAGAPYALATSLRLSHRITGSLHLLAPYVNASVQGQSAGYKWLKYIPKGMIQTAHTAEWKLTAWKLGRPPVLVQQPVENNPRAPVSSADYRRDNEAPVEFPYEDDVDETESILSFGTEGKKTPTRSLFGSRSSSLSTSRALKPFHDRKTSLASSRSVDSSSPPLLQKERKKSPPSSLAGYSIAPSSTPSSEDIAAALLKASHAESLKGGTADLMVILERSGKPSSYRYHEISTPCKIWHGDKDDRISLTSVKSMAQAIPECTLKVVPGEHNLMTDAAVVIDVLQSIQAEITAPVRP